MISLKVKLREWKYWNIDRKTQKFVPWLARKLPKNLQYYVVVHGMVKVEPNFEPTKVTGVQLLKYFETPNTK